MGTQDHILNDIQSTAGCQTERGLTLTVCSFLVFGINLFPGSFDRNVAKYFLPILIVFFTPYLMQCFWYNIYFLKGILFGLYWERPEKKLKMFILCANTDRTKHRDFIKGNKILLIYSVNAAS